MPWKASDAKKHTRKVTGSKRLQRMWAHVANSELKAGADDTTAIKAANSAVSKAKG